MEKNKRKPVHYTFIIFILLIAGCSASKTFRVNEVMYHNGPQTIKKLSKFHPFIIAHQGDSAWHLSNVQINNISNSLIASLNELSPERMAYKFAAPCLNNKVHDDNIKPFDEMHIYVDGLRPDSSGQILIHKENIYGIQIYNSIGREVLTFIMILGLAILWAGLWVLRLMLL